ncbi:hypothetical protein F2981_18290 (plasmid) [Sinorhizobium meliloti]|nr:hypothetical protein [Sinorhizobium meliloti]
MLTADADFAQFYSDFAVAVDDQVPPMLETLKKVDPTFREIPHQSRRSLHNAVRVSEGLQGRIPYSKSWFWTNMAGDRHPCPHSAGLRLSRSDSSTI